MQANWATAIISSGRCFLRSLWKVFLLLSLNFPPPKCCLITPHATLLNVHMPQFPSSLPRLFTCRGRHMLLYDPITLFFSSVSSFHRKMGWTLFPKLGGITGNSEWLTTKEWQRSNKDMRSWTRKLAAVGSAGIRRARGYLLLDAILDNRSPIQSQEPFLRQVPHQADNGLLTALGGHAFLLLLIHDHFLNPGASQNKQLIFPTST